MAAKVDLPAGYPPELWEAFLRELDEEADAWVAATARLIKAEKHLGGHHDQQTHAGGGGTWGGKIKGATPQQEKQIREAIGDIPSHLLTPSLNVLVELQTKIGDPGVVGYVSILKPDRIHLNAELFNGKYSQEQVKYWITHEVGHTVAVKFNKRYKIGDYDKFVLVKPELVKELETWSTYAKTNPAEAFAEGFAGRITHRAKFGPATDDLFKRMKI